MEVTQDTEKRRNESFSSVFSVFSVVNLLFDRAEHEPSVFTEALRF
jgi:hypothetical protein